MARQVSQARKEAEQETTAQIEKARADARAAAQQEVAAQLEKANKQAESSQSELVWERNRRIWHEGEVENLRREVRSLKRGKRGLGRGNVEPW